MIEKCHFSYPCNSITYKQREKEKREIEKLAISVKAETALGEIVVAERALYGS